MTNATNWDAGAPATPTEFNTWGEAISDSADSALQPSHRAEADATAHPTIDGRLNDLEAVPSTNLKTVYNSTGSTIAAGTLLEIVGSAGAVSTVRPADKDTAVSVDGIATESISAAATGDMQVGGTASDLNTSGLTAGSPLWVGDDGAFVDAAPASGAVIRIGKVGVVSPSGGTVVLNLPAFPALASEVEYDGTLTATRVDAALDELDAGKLASSDSRLSAQAQGTASVRAIGTSTPAAPGTAAAGNALTASASNHVHARQTSVTGTEMASGVSVWWFDAGANASAARPAGAAATDVVIWTNTPSVPTNLGARDQWEDAS